MVIEPDQQNSEENKPTTPEEHHEELQKAADHAQDILIKAESTFPFVLFPDTITVSRMKVTITRRSFFNVADVISLQIEDILNVEIDAGPFFGSLNIFTRVYGSEPLRITFLARKSAIDVKRILEGYVIARQRDIDTSTIEKHELIALLTKLGSDSAMM
jgi:hypothetical protein